jgi:hypothetical protein
VFCWCCEGCGLWIVELDDGGEEVPDFIWSPRTSVEARTSSPYHERVVVASPSSSQLAMTSPTAKCKTSAAPSPFPLHNVLGKAGMATMRLACLVQVEEFRYDTSGYSLPAYGE